MLMHEVIQQTGLTKKAIEYSCEQGLVSTTTLENGYREFDAKQVERLQRISVLRKLGVSTGEIRAVLDDSTGQVLQKLSVQKALQMRREAHKEALLSQLSAGKSYGEVGEALVAIEAGVSIAQRLLDAFPGYYGRVIGLHFARFLNQPIQTETQQAAYERVVTFLDNIPSFEMPAELHGREHEAYRHRGHYKSP